MFPKRSRLRSGEVKEVLVRGKSLRVGPYTGKFLDGRVPLGLAVIVSKKVARKAVTRNSLRRKVYRELERLTLPPKGSLALFVRTVQ